MCHRYRRNQDADRSDSGNARKVDTEPHNDSVPTSTPGSPGNNVPLTEAEPYKNVEPLPESSRERRDGPGGE